MKPKCKHNNIKWLGNWGWGGKIYLPLMLCLDCKAIASSHDGLFLEGNKDVIELFRSGKIICDYSIFPHV